MKKTYYLLLFTMLSAVVANAQTNCVTKKLDEKRSVKFPAEPEKTTKNGIDIYTLRRTDSIGYSANVMDYNIVVHLDSALAPIKDTQEFADQMMMGIASSKQNYTFRYVVIGKWNTYTTYDIPAVDKIKKTPY